MGRSEPHLRRHRAAALWNQDQEHFDKLPKKHHDDALAALREIMYIDDEQQGRPKLEALARSFEHGYPKAATCARDDIDRMFAYHRFPTGQPQEPAYDEPESSRSLHPCAYEPMRQNGCARLDGHINALSH